MTTKHAIYSPGGILAQRGFFVAALAIAIATAVYCPTISAAETTLQQLTTETQLRARYAPPPSKFVMVDGVPLHLRDEGKGAPLILLNGHLGSLHMWDAWMPALTRRFRVIRLDYPPYGLSGPDPSGVYSTARAVDLLGKLADQLKLKRFHVGGTSNGALVVVFYAIEHPDRVDRLVVSTLPAGRPPPRTPSAAMIAAVAESQRLAPFQPREFFDAFLHDIIANDAIITPQLIDRYFDINNRAGAKTWVDAYIQTQYQLWDSIDIAKQYARLTRPILIQWGADGVVLPEQIGRDVAALFVNAPTTLTPYRGAGHLPMIEKPDLTVREAVRFLRRGELR